MFWKVFDAIRRITIFILGTLVITEALYNEDVPIKSIILGMIMIGILPLEDLLPWSRKNEERQFDSGTGYVLTTVNRASTHGVVSLPGNYAAQAGTV
jgi:ABC-type iron transport system FetAB permease component